MEKLPTIGSKEFRSLSFRDQLQVVSINIFDPELAKVGLEECLCKIDLSIPPNSPIQQSPLAGIVVKNHWAGYNASFRRDWFSIRGRCTPFEEFGIDYKKIVNVWGFTFPLLALLPGLQAVFKWVSNNSSVDSDDFVYDSTSLVVACKVYSYLESLLDKDKVERAAKNTFDSYYRRISINTAELVSLNAKNVFAEALSFFSDKDIFTFESMNSHAKTLEECQELYAYEYGDFLLHRQSRFICGRWCWPLIPSRCYEESRFHIYSWGPLC